MTAETRTFGLSWHYRWVILPIIWFCVTLYLISIAVQYAGVERWIMWEKVHAHGKKYYISTLMENNSEIFPALKAHNPDIETLDRG